MLVAERGRRYPAIPFLLGHSAARSLGVSVSFSLQHWGSSCHWVSTERRELLTLPHFLH